MKIVVMDGYVLCADDLSWNALDSLNCAYEIYDRTDIDDRELGIARAADADIIVTNKYPITKEFIDACPKLRAVAVTATGYNVVDTSYAKAKGIPVMNVPAYGTDTVSQFTVGMLLDLCARFEHHDRAVKEGRWSSCPDFCFWDSPIVELSGKTAGIIGLGRIGRATAGVLKALNMNVIAYNRSQCEEGKAVAEYVDLDTVYERSDVILLHCPLTEQTNGMINRNSIAKMKNGVLLINTSRGPLVVEQDLADALNSGKVAGAAVDVLSEEPASADNPLLHAKNCLITPHIAWASKEARKRILDITIDNIRGFIDGNLDNVVNQ